MFTATLRTLSRYVCAVSRILVYFVSRDLEMFCSSLIRHLFLRLCAVWLHWLKICYIHTVLIPNFSLTGRSRSQILRFYFVSSQDAINLASYFFEHLLKFLKQGETPKTSTPFIQRQAPHFIKGKHPDGDKILLRHRRCSWVTQKLLFDLLKNV